MLGRRFRRKGFPAAAEASGPGELTVLAVALSIATGAGCEGGLAGGNKSAAANPSRAAAGVAPPTAGTAEYKGNSIVWDERVDPPRLSIEAVPFVVRRLGAGKDTRYHTSALSYMDCASLLELAHALIDTGIVRMYRQPNQ